MAATFGPLRRPLRFLQKQLPPINFITLHYLYFILTCLISAIIFWGASTPARSVSFTNSLFLTVSAMTLAGLNTINLSELNTFQQVLLFLLIMLGSAIFVSSFVVGVRKRAFEKKLIDFAQHRTLRVRGRSRTRLAVNTANEPQATKYVSGADNGTDDGETVLEKGPENLSHISAAPANASGSKLNSTAQNYNSLDETYDPSSCGNDPERSVADEQSGVVIAVPNHIVFSDETQFTATPSHHGKRPRRRGSSSSLFKMQGVGALPNSSLNVTGHGLLDLPEKSSSPRRDHHVNIKHYFATTDGWLGRNSQFHGLTQDERELLGGYEYRAVALLGWLVPLYFILWQLFGCIACAAWVGLNAADKTRKNGLNPWWVGAFNAVSAFNNSGMSLLDANMIAFQRSYFLLLTMGLLILAGNTCYPIFLRMILWCMLKMAARMSKASLKNGRWHEWECTIRFLLDHPRRCYTNLFPSQHTWWLTLSVFTLNGIDWAAFEILNIGNKELDRGLPTRFRVIDGLFQAFAVRSGGFYVVAIPTLRISLQVLYVVMMYISVYPVVITMRNSNVYEERSLGIYAEDDDGSDRNKQSSGGRLLRHMSTLSSHFVGGTGGINRETNSQFVRHQLRAQLAHDAWVIVLALFLIMICEADSFQKDPVIYSVFNFIFEIVSAYGCVGISVGVPYNSYSFCGAWNTLSKLILCAVMLRGRHRGLPVAIDKAVLLPNELHSHAEEEDGRIRIARSRTGTRSKEDA